MDALMVVASIVMFVSVLGALTARSRRRRAPAVSGEGVFRCRVRASGAADGTRTWPSRTISARWVHDVLVLHWGVLGRPRRALGVRTAYGVLEAVRSLTSDEGDVSLWLQLDNGSVIRVTARESAAEALGGPFLCALPVVGRTPRP